MSPQGPYVCVALGLSRLSFSVAVGTVSFASRRIVKGYIPHSPLRRRVTVFCVPGYISPAPANVVYTSLGTAKFALTNDFRQTRPLNGTLWHVSVIQKREGQQLLPC